eukprot:evm.model.scf_1042.1 EVM.evm.TU.scf_1042.1   scf_1042:20644-24714(-)
MGAVLLGWLPWALYLSALLRSVCGDVAGDADAGVRRAVTDCRQLQREVAGGADPADVVELGGHFACGAGEWTETVILDRDLLVVGRNGSGVDWGGLEGVWVVAPGVDLRFRRTNFLVDRLADEFRPPFLALEDGAAVSMAGVVLGSRCCLSAAEADGDAACSAGAGDRLIGQERGGDAWRVCSSLVRCGAADFDSLRAIEGAATDGSCGSAAALAAGAEGGEGGGSGGAATATTVSLVVVLLAVVAIAGVAALLWYRRQKGRQAPAVEFKNQPATKVNAFLSVPSSLSSFSGSHQGLIQSSPVTVHSIDKPAPVVLEGSKPPAVTSNIDVGGIRLSIPIGKGAFATVYKGSWVGKTVAVKILQHPPDQKTLPAKSMFEAQLGFSVMHVNLVHTLGTQTKKCQDVSMITPRSSRPSSTSFDKPMSMVDDYHGQSRASSDCFSDMADVLKAQGKEEYETWIVMEYCDQGSLQGAIQRGAFFDDAEKTRPRMVDVLLTALDIAKGMEHLHSLSIVHGDLKPRNVLLRTKKGDVRGYICKVGDFGFSRALLDTQLETASCGAVNYMPPELLAQGILTPAADVYSFGVLLWELLVGSNPYPSKTQNEILVLVTSGRRPAVPARIPDQYADLIQSCWHQSRQARPTFTEISATLRDLLADPSMEWHPWRPPTSHGRPPRSASQNVTGFSFEKPRAPPDPLPSPVSNSVVSPLASPLASPLDTPLQSRLESPRGSPRESPLEKSPLGSPVADSSVADSTVGPLPSPLPSPMASSVSSYMPSFKPPVNHSDSSGLQTPPPFPKGQPSEMDHLSPLQDFAPTPLDPQPGASMACVTSDSMKNLFLKDLEMSAGQGMLPQFDDLLATVKISRKPRIPTGKKTGQSNGREHTKDARPRAIPEHWRRR